MALSMQISKVHHISLNVADIHVATAFYVEVMGLSLLPRPDLGFPGTWLAMGEQQLHLMEKPKASPDQGQHFAFAVDNIVAKRDYLIGRGVEVTPIRQVSDICLQCFFLDPAGNRLELNQPL